MQPIPNLLPSTTAGWEIVLVDYFLRIGTDDDASPIRSFELTAETLLSASRVEGLVATDVEEAFKSALLADPYLWGALRDGHSRPTTESVPNCLTYLAMTLLIDTLLEGDYSDIGQFRNRLRSWLGTQKSVMQLSGVALMWRRLVSWLDDKVDGGEPFRRLELPAPGSWTQIGYTRRLSFPTRADARFLERTMAASGCGMTDPPGLIRAIEAAINHSGASWGMGTAFEDFRKSFRAGKASTDHRFWRLVGRSAAAGGRIERQEAVIELGFDEDNCFTISIGLIHDNAGLNPVVSLEAAMQADQITQSANLSQSADRGIAFFRQVGTARWRAQSKPPESSTGHIHLAFSSKWDERIRGATLHLVQSGTWLITRDPILPRKLDDLLARLHVSRSRAESLLDIELVDGVRVRGAWLGRRAFLPRIEAGDWHSTVTRLPGQGEGEEVSVRDGVLSSRGTVVGAYEITATANRESAIPGWSRHVKFVQNASPHSELAKAAFGQPLITEWMSVGPTHVNSASRHELIWNDLDPETADLLEAVYASGKSGCSEQELLDLIGRSIGRGPNCWSLLRLLQESGFTQARRRRGWRGHIWTLGEPNLVPVDGIGEDALVVEGALCTELEQEFREVVAGLGGEAFRILGLSTWTPPVLGAIGVNCSELATRLGWQADAAVPLEPGFGRLALETSNLVAEHHTLASTWDWHQRRFVAGGTHFSEVSLTRWVHPGGRDHDVYRVDSSSHSSSHLTRNSAILTAHIIASVPMFRFEDGFLVRTSQEGGLPLELARWLKLAALSGGGLLDGGSYVYPIVRQNAVRVAQALPGCIEGMPARDVIASTTDILMASRRSCGRKRVLWIDGMMVTPN